jgi:hypothetical protein
MVTFILTVNLSVHVNLVEGVTVASFPHLKRQKDYKQTVCKEDW